MPDGTQQVATTANSDLATMRFEDALDAYAPRFQAALPPNLPAAHFKAMVITAVNLTPELRYADRRTFFNACVKCASDGLLPDGREAALVVYRTKVKDRQGNEHYIDAAQYMPMIAGIRKRMRNTGEVLSAYAEVVYRHDKFYRELGDEPKIVHEPAPLGADRGEPVGAYAIIKLANGEVLRDVMTVKDIERSREQSRAKNSLMWTTFWDEGAKKTVLRRCSKAAPTASVLETLLARDEEEPELPPAEELPAIPPRPRRADFVETSEITAGDRQPEPYAVIDADGAEMPCGSPEIAAERLRQIIAEMGARDGERGLEAAWENNAHIISRLREEGRDDLADATATSYNEQVTAAQSRSVAASTAEFDSADAGSSPAATATPPTPQKAARGTGTDWPGYVEAVIAWAAALDDYRIIQQFRIDHARDLENLRLANLTARGDLLQALADRERVLRGGEP